MLPSDPRRPATRRIGRIRLVEALRIVIGQFAPIVGGAELQSQRLGDAFAARGARVEVFTRRLQPEHARNEVLGDLTVHRLGLLFPSKLARRALGTLSFAQALWSHLRADSTPVLVAHLLYPALIAAFARGPQRRFPLVIRVASTGRTSDFASWGKHASAVHRFVARRTDALVVLNESAREEAIAWGYDSQRISVIPNGIVCGPATIRTPGARLRVLYVGLLRKEKRVDLLLHAWKRAAIDADLIIAGDGPEKASAMEIARSLGIDAEFLGFRSDVSELTRGADVFVLPSDAEGMSNALVEAMVAERACLATFVGGNIDCLAPGGSSPRPGEVVEGEFGLLARCGDEEGFANGLRLLASSPSLRERLGRAARTRAIECYDINRVADQYVDLFRRLSPEMPPAGR